MCQCKLWHVQMLLLEQSCLLQGVFALVAKMLASCHQHTVAGPHEILFDSQRAKIVSFILLVLIPSGSALSFGDQIVHKVSISGANKQMSLRGNLAYCKGPNRSCEGVYGGDLLLILTYNFNSIKFLVNKA